MTFYEVVRQILDVLQQQGRVSYRALQREFGLDDAYLDDVKEDLLYAHTSTLQVDDRGLTWIPSTADSHGATSQPDRVASQSTAPHAPLSQAERRHLTVMFSDLVDSTQLSGQLDPEDYRDVPRAYQATCSEVIDRFDGYVAQHLGDALLVYFGFPQAHEDDAQRAILAGLGMLDAMQPLNTRLQQEKGLQLAIRVGLHTGVTIVGDVGSGQKHELLALGEAPNIASRIQGLAAPNTIAISAETYRLVQGYFACHDLGVHTLKGVATPMQVYRVSGASGASSRLDVAVRRGLTPLVGRESEVAFLLERWQQVQEGHGHVVLLCGEGGIGKSRLVQVLKEHVVSTDHTLLECRSSPYYQHTEMVETQPELLAHHYTEAGQDEAAVSYWQRAGQRALQRSAHVEAIVHLTQGLAVLSKLPETLELLQQELDLQVALGPALIATKGHAVPDVERVYARARELCQQVGDTPQLFPVLRGLMMYYQTRGQLQTAYRLGKQLLRLAHSQSEPALHMLAHHQLGLLLFWRGKPSSAHTHHTQVLAIYDPQEHQTLASRYGLHDLGVGSGSFLALGLWCLGYPDQAMQRSQEALTLAQEVSHPYSLVLALVWAAILHQFCRETPAVYEQTEAAITLATEQGFVLRLARGTILHGWAVVMQGQGEVGIAEMGQGLAAELATGVKLLQPYFLGLLAEAYGEAGQPEEGLSLLTKAVAMMDTTKVRSYGAELYRLKATLLLRQAVPDVPQAEVCFHQALDIALRQQAKSWELRAATSLARLWQQQDKRQEAYDLLAPVYNWFTEGFDTADLQDAKALLDALSCG
jgi:class 3 adenylate cyclase/predicted ATPase